MDRLFIVLIISLGVMLVGILLFRHSIDVRVFILIFGVFEIALIVTWLVCDLQFDDYTPSVDEARYKINGYYADSYDITEGSIVLDDYWSNGRYHDDMIVILNDHITIKDRGE